jgi:uncharacterized protein (DUF4415 family)
MKRDNPVDRGYSSLDADIVEWLKQDGDSLRIGLNSILREVMVK